MSHKTSTNIEDFASTTTVHGASGLLISKSKAGKFAWLCVMMTSLGGLVYMTYKATDEYRKHPTSLEWSLKTLTETPMIAVLAPKVNRTKVEMLGLTKPHILYLLSHEQSYVLTPKDEEALSSNNLAKLREDVNQVARIRNLSLYGLLEHVMMDWTALVKINGGCNVTTHLGQIGSFGMTSKLKDGYLSEVIFSFTITSIINEESFIKHGWLPEKRAFLTIGSLSSSFARNIAIEPGTVNIISFLPEFTNLLNRPGSPCHPGKISESFCNDDCYMKLVECLNDCKWWTKEAVQSDTRFCRHLDIRSLDNTSTINPGCDEKFNKCMNTCLPPCEVVRYNDRETNIGPLDPEIYGDNITNLFYVVLRKGRRVTNYQEKYTYTVSTFISNIGGLMGLFFGASLVSLVHLGVYMFLKPCTK